MFRLILRDCRLRFIAHNGGDVSSLRIQRAVAEPSGTALVIEQIGIYARISRGLPMRSPHQLPQVLIVTRNIRVAGACSDEKCLAS